MDGAASRLNVKDSRSPRILICRLSAIGDCILTMPLAVALRRAFPGAFIAWGVQGASAPLIEAHSCVDLTIKISKKELSSPMGLWSLRKRLREQKFDIALDPQGLTKSALVSWLSGAPRRIGFARPVAREISPWLQTDLVCSQQSHVVDRYLELLGPLKVNLHQAEFKFPTDAAAQTSLAPFLGQPLLQNGFAVVNPGAGWDSRLWPVDRYGEVAKYLSHAQQLPTVIVWAGDRERVWAEEIKDFSDGAAILAPKTSLLELGELLRRARLFVGSDTGPLHMAAAVGIPCVGIHGPTRPENSGAYGPGHKVVQAYYQGGTSRERRFASNEAMLAAATTDVCTACGEILARPSLAKSPLKPQAA